MLAGVHARGARVVVITNSLASTDGLPVHSKYQLYRKALLQAGIELYEMKPTAGAKPGESSGSFRGSSGSGSASLHAKTFTFDRRIGFIGSYNLGRAPLNKLNTEMGVLFDCPALCQALARNVRARSRAQRLSPRDGRQPPRLGDAREWKRSPLSLRTRSRFLEAFQASYPELAADRGPALSSLEAPGANPSRQWIDRSERQLPHFHSDPCAPSFCSEWS